MVHEMIMSILRKGIDHVVVIPGRKNNSLRILCVIVVYAYHDGKQRHMRKVFLSRICYVIVLNRGYPTLKSVNNRHQFLKMLLRR